MFKKMSCCFLNNMIVFRLQLCSISLFASPTKIFLQGKDPHYLHLNFKNKLSEAQNGIIDIIR